MDLLPLPASPLKIYRQAKRILRTTSRANEPGWYRKAHEHDLQWHIWIGTQSGTSAIYSRGARQWWVGPDLPSVSLETDDNGVVTGLSTASRDALHQLIQQIITNKEFGAKAKSLGILIHLADGLRIRDLVPDFAAGEDYENLNELLISAPDIAIGDDTVDNKTGSWRLLPLLGSQEESKRSLAVQISSKLMPIVKELRSYGEIRNLPVIVNVRSAPLESISGISYLHPAIQSEEAGSSLVLLQYESMTLLFATGKRAELRLVRPLQHRGATHLSAEEIHEVLFQTAALLNVKNPNIIFASFTGLSEGELNELLASYRTQFPQVTCYCYDVLNSPFTKDVPEGRFELAVSAQEVPPLPNEAPLQKKLRETWTWQDFYGPSREEAALMPNNGDLKLLKYGLLAQKIALVSILVFCGWTGMDFITKMRSPAWRLSSDSAQTMEMQLAKLQKEKSEWKHWSGLLEKRSEGWLTMEALLEIFPADGGVILRDALYRAEASASAKDQEASKLGMKRQWTISGFANPEVATELATLGSRQRIAEVMNSIAELNHAPYLSVNSETREVQVSLQQKQGTMSPSLEFPEKIARHFRTSFDLNITQSMSNQDELAINTSLDSE